MLDNLLWVADFHLNLLGQVVECLAHEVGEELYLLEDPLVRLLEVVLLHLRRQVGDELLLLFVVEDLPEPGCLLDVVVDLPA